MLKRIMCFGAALMIGMCIFCGCGKEPLGTFYTLQEAYDEGLLSVEDIKSIAYYRYDGNEWIYAGIDVNEEDYYELQPTDYVPIPKIPETLDKKTGKAIKETGAANKRLQTHLDGTSRYPRAKAKDFTIMDYYGTYSDCVAIRLNDSFTDYPDVEREVVVAGVTFVYSGASITIWKQK